MSSLALPDPFLGHLGHLSEAQTAALDAFKNHLTQAGLWTAGSNSVDDVTLL
jgi:hypothetical protein